MYRNFMKNLEYWKNKGMDIPLMVVGARQIGKTYTIDEFCKKNFKNYMYINLEKDIEIQRFFEETIDPDKIIEKIEIKNMKKIDIANTVIFIDEIQVSERAITSLKYFCESDKSYKIICAGSLLGVKLNRFNSSFPVGKVRIEYMYPMNFEEFAIALGREMLIKEVEKCFTSLKEISKTFHDMMLNIYRQYLCVGGMPAAVMNFIENSQDIVKFNRDIHQDIITSYLSDMTKYTDNKMETTRINAIYNSMPSQLAKDNKKFQYSLTQEYANKRDFETSLDWLLASNMVYKCTKINKVETPLKVYQDVNNFKLYLNDVGLLSTLCEVKYSDIMISTNFMFKGAITENYIAQVLTSNKVPLYFWKSNNIAEVDYILDVEDGIIPIEVKASDNTNSKSLNAYMQKYSSKYGIRISTKNFGFSNNIKAIPLYAAYLIRK